jgi:hypothetical protein
MKLSVGSIETSPLIDDETFFISSQSGSMDGRPCRSTSQKAQWTDQGKHVRLLNQPSTPITKNTLFQIRLDLANGLRHADKQGAAHDGMSNIQLMQVWDLQHFADVGIVNSMSGIHH